MMISNCIAYRFAYIPTRMEDKTWVWLKEYKVDFSIIYTGNENKAFHVVLEKKSRK